MKKNLLSVILSIFLVSCDDSREGTKAPSSKRMEFDSASEYWDQPYRIYTLEGCEYIVYGTGSHRWGTHKGNCKNPIHNQVQCLKK